MCFLFTFIIILRLTSEKLTQDETTLTGKFNNNEISNLADTKPPSTTEHIRSLLRDTNMRTAHRTEHGRGVARG